MFLKDKTAKLILITEYAMLLAELSDSAQLHVVVFVAHVCTEQ